MLAAEQDQAEQELPKSICQPRHVRLFVLALNAGSLVICVVLAMSALRPLFPRNGGNLGHGSRPPRATRLFA